MTLEELKTAFLTFKQNRKDPSSLAPDQSRDYIVAVDASLICPPLERIIENLDISDSERFLQLAYFLTVRWSLIQRSMLSYTHQHTSETTKLCLAIAQYLHHKNPHKKVIQYLMPTIIRIVDIAKIFETDDIDDIPLSQMILDEDGQGVIPVKILMSQTINGDMTDLYHPYSAPGVSPRKLTVGEAHTLLNWSESCSQLLADIRQQYQTTQSEKNTIGLGLMHLIAWLKQGSRTGGHGGSDDAAGVDAYVGIGLFQRCFLALPPDEQASIRAMSSGSGTHTLGYYMDLLLRKETLNDMDGPENSWHCVETVAADLEGIVEKNPVLFQHQAVGLESCAETFDDVLSGLLSSPGHDAACDCYYTQYITKTPLQSLQYEYFCFLYASPGENRLSYIQKSSNLFIFAILYEDDLQALLNKPFMQKRLKKDIQRVMTYAFTQGKVERFNLLMAYCQKHRISVALTDILIKAIQSYNQQCIGCIWGQYRSQLSLTSAQSSLIFEAVKYKQWSFASNMIEHFLPANQPLSPESRFEETMLLALQHGQIDFFRHHFRADMNLMATIPHNPGHQYHTIHYAVLINQQSLWQTLNPHLSSALVMATVQDEPSPIQLATQKNNMAIVQHLLSFCQVAALKQVDWRSLLMIAVKEKNAPLLRQLWTYQAHVHHESLQEILDFAVDRLQWWAVYIMLNNSKLDYSVATCKAMEAQQFDLVRALPVSQEIYKYRSDSPQTSGFDVVALAYHYRQLDLLDRFKTNGGSLVTTSKGQPSYLCTLVRIVMDGNSHLVELDKLSKKEHKALAKAVLTEAIKSPRNEQAVLRLASFGAKLNYKKDEKTIIQHLVAERPVNWAFIHRLLQSIQPHKATWKNDRAEFGELLLDLAKNKQFDLISDCLHPNISMEWYFTHSGKGAMHFIIEHDALDIMPLLLPLKNQNPLKSFYDARPCAMAYAIQTNKLAAVEIMMRYWQENPSQTSQKRAMAALFIALKGNHHDVIRLMCPFILDWSLKYKGKTALAVACQDSDQTSLDMIDPFFQDYPDREQVFSASVHRCIKSGHVLQAQRLAPYGISILYTKDDKSIADLLIDQDTMNWPLTEAVIKSQQDKKNLWQHERAHFGRFLLRAMNAQKFDLVPDLIHAHISWEWHFQSTGHSPLHLAIQHQALHVMDLMLKAGAQPFVQFNKKPAAFDYAISKQKNDAILVLLTHFLTQKDHYDDLVSALKMLLEKSYFEPIEMFFEQNLDFLRVKGGSCLLETLLSINNQQISDLVQKHPFIVVNPIELRTAILNVAIRARDVKAFDQRDPAQALIFSDSLNPLKTAIIHQQWWCVDRLVEYLQKSPMQRQTAQMEFAVLHAMKAQQFKMVRAMLFEGINLDFAISDDSKENGFTVLHYAIQFNQPELFHQFLMHGANPEKYYYGQRNALEYAQSIGDEASVIESNQFLSGSTRLCSTRLLSSQSMLSGPVNDDSDNPVAVPPTLTV